MPRLDPLDRDAVPVDLKPLMAAGEAMMGFLPNDALTMARRPEILTALFDLIQAIYGDGNLTPGLKRLIGEAASKAAGCHYCSAHAAYGAHRHGVEAEKIEAVWSYENSPLFSDAERAAIRVAMAAAQTPNAVTDEDFEILRQHFTDDEVVEIVAVIAMFGFLNRWNSTLATELESLPASLANALRES